MDQFRKPQAKTNITQAQAQAAPTNVKEGKSKVFRLVLVGLMLVLLVGGGAFAFKYYSKDPTFASVKKDQYQALFLTNGQVYFGKITALDSRVVKVSDIYYLQVTQKVQPTEENKQAEGEPQLIKLGEELHGPEDEMFIERSQVSFWENLKDGSKVSEAIKAYKKQ